MYTLMHPHHHVSRQSIPEKEHAVKSVCLRYMHLQKMQQQLVL